MGGDRGRVRMVPRSLAVAIAVGAASGAAAALALSDVRDGQDGPLELEPGSDRYAPGSPVTAAAYQRLGRAAANGPPGGLGPCRHAGVRQGSCR